MTITFKSEDTFTAFMVMAENMWLNYRDDNAHPEFDLVDRLMDELNNQRADKALDVHLAHGMAGNVAVAGAETEPSNPMPRYPMTLRLSNTTSEMAQSVLDNALYQTELGEEEGEGPYIHPGEVTIQ